MNVFDKAPENDQDEMSDETKNMILELQGDMKQVGHSFDEDFIDYELKNRPTTVPRFGGVATVISVRSICFDSYLF